LQSRQYYQPYLSSLRLDPIGERAFDDLLTVCAAHDITVTLCWLPESSEFRSWYSPMAEQLAVQHFNKLGHRPGVRLINAREWVADEFLGDGFHLIPKGAVEFTRRLATEMRWTAP
jgi:hypothetical protein